MRNPHSYQIPNVLDYDLYHPLEMQSPWEQELHRPCLLVSPGPGTRKTSVNTSGVVTDWQWRVYLGAPTLPRVVAWLARREVTGASNPMAEGERAPGPPRRTPDSQCRGCYTMKTSLSEFRKVSITITPCSACRLTQKPSDYHLA